MSPSSSFKLTDAQIDLLGFIHEQRRDAIELQLQSRGWKRTVAKLEDLGLVTRHGVGTTSITKEGRDVIKELLKSGKAVKVG